MFPIIGGDPSQVDAGCVGLCHAWVCTQKCRRSSPRERVAFRPFLSVLGAQALQLW
jgi:hypothetical protein